MGFRRGVLVWILYVAAFWGAYDASWFLTLVVTAGIVFIGVPTAVEALVSDSTWTRIEEQIRERQRSSLASDH